MHPLRNRTWKCGVAVRTLASVLVWAFVLGLTWGIILDAGVSYAAASPRAETEAARLASLVNDEREDASLAPLELDEDLCQVAASHAADMIEAKYFGHMSPDGSTLAARLRKAGVSASKSAENLAGHTSVTAAHDLLMKSPAHRGNILNDEFTRVGIAVLRGGPYGLMIVEVFASEPK